MGKVKYKVDLESLIDKTSNSSSREFLTQSFLSVPLPDSAHLLTDSYRGTIDWEDGDDEVVAQAELRATIEGKYGEFLAEASFSTSDTFQSNSCQIVVADLKSEATILFIYTHPDFQGKGLATRLIGLTARELKKLGYSDLFLYVTEGNPAENLYQSLGFGRVGEGLAE